MKIAVVIPSKGRPKGINASLRALQASASRRHDIEYVVSYCSHEPETRDAALEVGALAIRRPDDCTPGAAFNHAARKVDADVYTGFGDDVFPLTWNWDDYLASAVKHPLIVFCWQEMNDPHNVSYLASSARVMRAIGDLCPEYFPYWFVDLWLAEIHAIAFGHFPNRVEGLKLCCNNRGITQGHRDFPFWCEVFTRTRDERIRLGIKLAAEYGSTPPNMKTGLAFMAAADADRLSKADLFSKRFGDAREPEPYYVKAKARAEAMLAKSLTAA